MGDGADLVVVGGGIAGASLAAAMAGAGLDVVVLEASERFVDRVRGESMMPWGVAEADRLGVGPVLRAAGAHVAPVWRRYGEGSAEAREIPVGMLVPGVEGSLNLHHPTACQALLDAAAEAGADVRRGVREVSVAQQGDGAQVGYRRHGRSERIGAPLVVGADGRSSTVRRALGIELDRVEATAAVVGLLLDGLVGADDHDVIAEQDHGMSLLFHQGAGRARAYHVVPVGDRSRYAGPAGPARFVDDLRGGPPELGSLVEAAVPAGPCAAFPNTQGRTATPARGSVVLIGDAAGQTDPSVGCGLSVAMRDARTVGDLILSGARTAEDFAPYAAQRLDLVHRLQVIAEVVVSSSVVAGADRSARRARFGEAMAAMHPEVFPLVLAMFAGPESAPADVVTPGLPPVLRAA